MSKDVVDRMLEEIGRRPTPDVPLVLTAARQVFLKEEGISDIDLDA